MEADLEKREAVAQTGEVQLLAAGVGCKYIWTSLPQASGGL